jgi:deoxyribodipyrimidine photo-lyase
MSNRGRQNVASYFVKDLKQDWRIGAAYFEEQLIDYDVCSNWGNWNYVAGIGNDPREDRYFNTYKQATMYDPDAQYIKNWVPELKSLSPTLAFKPHLLSKEEQSKYGVTLGVHYPMPLVRIN